jgi:predicted ATP-grasp superfamily ATP-dependent carboligase
MMHTTTILIHEWVTGGGLAGHPLPPSLAPEGHAMRRSLARDFSAVPGIRVVVTLDDRLADEPGPWSIARVGTEPEGVVLPRLVATADYTVLIAPETEGILADRARLVDRFGGRSLGSTSAAIEATADKLRLGEHLASLGIATPDCRRVVPRRGLPDDFPYPAVLKPIDGAGSQHTYLVDRAGACPDGMAEWPEALLQPYVAGEAMSASFLVGPTGQARLIAAGRQHVKVRHGLFVYEGGTLPVPPRGVAQGPWRAVQSVVGLHGFVGVDYVWDEAAGCATVLEINPRPTTSCVGLTHWLPSGSLAQAWLQVASATDRIREWNSHGLFEANGLQGTVTFGSDGEIMTSGVGVSPR